MNEERLRQEIANHIKKVEKYFSIKGREPTHYEEMISDKAMKQIELLHNEIEKLKGNLVQCTRFP